jgi:hypothetical protein
LLDSKQIAECINILFKKETFEPIKVGWKCNPNICINDNVGKLDIAANDNAITNVQKDREQASSSVRMATRTSTRSKKAPATKTHDFLW